jgi:hypothetical protein
MLNLMSSHLFPYFSYPVMRSLDFSTPVLFGQNTSFLVMFFCPA